MNISFNVQNQTITREASDVVLRTGSREYLTLTFTFSEEWDTLVKTLFFSYGDYTNGVIIMPGVPVEVPAYYTQQAYFLVSLVGQEDTFVLPTNAVSVVFQESNHIWTSVAPDPDSIPYQQLMEMIQSYDEQIAAKEDKANKVTALNADVTDEQYPSAKAVFDMDELLAQALTGLAESLPETYLSKEPGAVQTENLADGAVTGAKIETGAVTGGKIASSAVTSQKIAPNAVTGPKIAANSVSESHIVNGAVTASKIASNAVHESQIAAGAVVEGKIAASAVTPPKIANGAVTSDKLGAGAVTAVKLAPQLLQAIQGAERQSHKVTAVDSTSTDTQYPSAKAVYDYGQSIQTAIEGGLDLVREALGYTEG